MNDNCKFAISYSRPNVFHFEVKDDCTVCAICKSEGLPLICSCRKIWEIDEETSFVKVYHHGLHNCTAVPIVQPLADKFESKFTENPKISPLQAGNEIIVEALEEEVPYDELINIVNGVIGKGKISYIKKKVLDSNRPYGHSFEAVARFKTGKLS